MGVLLTHYAISTLICTAATSASFDPDRVKFKRAVRVIRRRVADPVPPDAREQALARAMANITDLRDLNQRCEHLPRVIKRGRRSSYRLKKPGGHGARHGARPPSGSPTR